MCVCVYYFLNERLIIKQTMCICVYECSGIKVKLNGLLMAWN